MGEREEPEVVVGGDELVEAVERLLDRRRRLDRVEREGGTAAQRHRGDHAERSDRHPGGPPAVAIVVRAELDELAVGERQLDRPQGRGDVRVGGAGPVRARRRRAGERLDVDVAEVGERQAVVPEDLAERAEP